jgi:ribosomal protein S8
MKLSFSEKIQKRFIVIYGKKGEIKWDLDNNKIYITKLKKKVISYIKENLYLKQLRYILENKKSKKETVSLTEGINVLKIIKKMKNS